MAYLERCPLSPLDTASTARIMRAFPSPAYQGTVMSARSEKSIRAEAVSRFAGLCTRRHGAALA